MGRRKTRLGEVGAQVQVGRDGGDPVRFSADGAEGSGRAAVPPTADPGGFSQPGGDDTQETQRLGECGAQVQVGRDAGDPVRVLRSGCCTTTATVDAGGVSQPQEGRAGERHPAQDGTTGD